MLKWTVPFYLVTALFISCTLCHRINRNDAWKFLLKNAMVGVQSSDPVTNCGQSNLSPGCCKWQGQAVCFVEGGNCYCDNLCKFFGDCCCDVPATPPCDFVPSRTGTESSRCLTETTAPSEATQENPTTATPMPTTPLPHTCAAHNLNNGPDGCCNEQLVLCFVEYAMNGSVCFCDRSCHHSDECCSDVKSNGCYPRNCHEGGIMRCCNSSMKDECRVQIAHNNSCYCDQECNSRGDCCSDTNDMCTQIQGLPEPDVDQMENLLAVIETDNSILYERMAAAFWRRYNKMKRKQQSQNHNRRM